MCQCQGISDNTKISVDNPSDLDSQNDCLIDNRQWVWEISLGLVFAVTFPLTFHCVLAINILALIILL